MLQMRKKWLCNCYTESAQFNNRAGTNRKAEVKEDDFSCPINDNTGIRGSYEMSAKKFGLKHVMLGMELSKRPSLKR